MNIKVQRGSWIVTLPLAGAAAAYFFLVFSPGRRAIGELNEQMTLRREVVDQAAGQAAALTGLRRELEQTHTYVTAWRTHAPSEAELPALQGRIQELAKAAGIITSRFDPQDAVAHDAIRENTVGMECSGSFPRICEFLRSLEALSTTIWVETLQLDKDREDSEKTTARITLAIFGDNPENSNYAKRSE